MSGVENAMLQYGALGVLSVVILLIVKTMMESYRRMIEILQGMTSTLKSLQDNQAQMIRALQDVTRRLEAIERGMEREG